MYVFRGPNFRPQRPPDRRRLQNSFRLGFERTPETVVEERTGQSRDTRCTAVGMAVPTQRSETVVGLSQSETVALFQRACQVFMAQKDERSFDAVYQVMLSLSDDQVDKMLKTLKPQTRRAIAMWPSERRETRASVMCAPSTKCNLSCHVLTSLTVSYSFQDHLHLNPDRFRDHLHLSLGVLHQRAPTRWDRCPCTASVKSSRTSASSATLPPTATARLAFRATNASG